MGTYEIVDIVVNHPIEGLINKQNINYYNINGDLVVTEIYSIEESIIGSIRYGYSPI